MHGSADHHGAIKDHFKLQTCRNPALQIGQNGFDSIDRGNDIGIRLLGHIDKHSRAPIHPRNRARIAHTQIQISDIDETNGGAIAHFDNDATKFIGIKPHLRKGEQLALLLAIKSTQRTDRIGARDCHPDILP